MEHDVESSCETKVIRSCPLLKGEALNFACWPLNDQVVKFSEHPNINRFSIWGPYSISLKYSLLFMLWDNPARHERRNWKLCFGISTAKSTSM